ncbi:MAG: type II secretion system protein [Succinivibrionaceae bacterium]
MRNKDGFTLIELIAVMVIISIMSVYVGVKLTSFNAHEYIICRALVSELRHFQNINMNQNINDSNYLYFCVNNNSIALSTDKCLKEFFEKKSYNGVVLTPSSNYVNFNKLGQLLNQQDFSIAVERDSNSCLVHVNKQGVVSWK